MEQFLTESKISQKLRQKNWISDPKVDSDSEVFSYNLMKIHNRSKFHEYRICGCQVKNFQSFESRFSIHEMAHFKRFFGP